MSGDDELACPRLPYGVVVLANPDRQDRAMGDGRLGGRVERARAELFVGRRAELTVLEHLLRPEGEPSVAYVQAPGGYGKTQLLHAGARLARAQGYRVGWIDGKSAPWERESLARAVADVTPEPPFPFLLVLDSFEAIAPLEIWWRDELLPSLPARARVIFGGRLRLSPEWNEDPGWRRVMRVLPLGPLAPVDCREYLRRRRTSADTVNPIVDETRGYPLALALAADLTSGGGRQIESAGSPLMDVLAERLLEDAPDAVHMHAICASALVLHLREPQLEAVLGVAPPLARQLFRYLRSLSSVEATPLGLTMHDVVRTAIREHVRRRDPGLHGQLASRVARMLRDDLACGVRPELVNEVLYFMAVVQVWGDAYEYGECDIVVPDDAHWRSIEDLVLREEGAESLELLRYWRGAGAEAVVAVTASDEVAGFTQTIRLDRVRRAEAARDPGTAPLLAHWSSRGLLERRAPLPYVRHWALAFRYQGPSRVQTQLFGRYMRLLVAEGAAAGASCHAVRTGMVDLIARIPSYMPQHIPSLDFDLGGHGYALIGREFVEETPSQWLIRMIEGPAGPPATGGEPADLDPAAFADALRQVLRGLDRPDLIEGSPLLRTRLAGAGGLADRLARLQSVIREEACALFSSPRDREVRAAFERTYFGGPAKQEAIAAELKMAYSTYRRHLAAGMKRLTEALWRRESSIDRVASE